MFQNIIERFKNILKKISSIFDILEDLKLQIPTINKEIEDVTDLIDKVKKDPPGIFDKKRFVLDLLEIIKNELIKNGSNSFRSIGISIIPNKMFLLGTVYINLTQLTSNGNVNLVIHNNDKECTNISYNSNFMLYSNTQLINYYYFSSNSSNIDGYDTDYSNSLLIKESIGTYRVPVSSSNINHSFTESYPIKKCSKINIGFSGSLADIEKLKCEVVSYGYQLSSNEVKITIS